LISNLISNLISSLSAAVSFLTILPAGPRIEFGPKDVGRAAAWFPFVGALLGGIYIVVFWLFTQVFSPLLTAVILVGTDTWLTGALHLDGLADTADGFGAGRTREDVLRIMRDHALGSYGVAALVLVIALKVAALAALIEAHRAVDSLLLASVLSRWSPVLLSATQTYARPLEDDLPKSVGSPTRFVGPSELIVATLTALAVALAVDRSRGFAAFMLVAATSVWWAWRCRLRIGGVTGDTLGAGIEMSQCVVLLLFTALR
jgi:adenosylcobinamide-GDP ribazoletransferase